LFVVCFFFYILDPVPCALAFALVGLHLLTYASIVMVMIAFALVGLHLLTYASIVMVMIAFAFLLSDFAMLVLLEEYYSHLSPLGCNAFLSILSYDLILCMPLPAWLPSAEASSN
jgi:hypothetical protein